MACRFAKQTDEYHGYECEESGGACMFLTPSEKKCFEIYGDGPLAFEEEEYKSTEHISCSTEEVCEWVEKSVDSIKLVREPHRLRLFHIEEERQYCPYCGKKIKVVE